jgi:hypothetical protein
VFSESELPVLVIHGIQVPALAVLGNSEGRRRAGAVRPRPFPLSSPYSALLSSGLVGSSVVLGMLAQEVMIAATFSVLR